MREIDADEENSPNIRRTKSTFDNINILKSRRNSKFIKEMKSHENSKKVNKNGKKPKKKLVASVPENLEATEELKKIKKKKK